MRRLAKAKAELGFTGSRASVQRFYRCKAQERFLKDLAEADAEAKEVEGSAADTGRLRRSGMKAVAQRFFRQVRDEGIADVPLMAKLLLQSEANEIQQAKRDLQRLGLELRRQRLEFQRERWQYDVMNRTEELLPELVKENAKQAEAGDPYFENKRTNKLRRTLFGDPIPEPLPESAAEEAAMKAEAERVKAHEQELMKLPYEERCARVREEQEQKWAEMEREIMARHHARLAGEAAKTRKGESTGNIG